MNGCLTCSSSSTCLSCNSSTYLRIDQQGCVSACINDNSSNSTIYFINKNKQIEITIKNKILLAIYKC